MRTSKDEDFNMLDESDEYLLKMTEELKHELSEIKVSEDLIARTLNRISDRKDEANPDSNVIPMEDRKASVKYRDRNYKWVKPLSVAAAACILLLLASSLMRDGIMIGGMKKESELDYANMAASKEEAEVNFKQNSVTPTILYSGKDSVADVKNDTTVSEDQFAQWQEKKTQEGVAAGILKIQSSYQFAYDLAMSEAVNTELVYGFEGYSEGNASKLLELLTSDRIRVTTEDVIEDVEYVLVFSLGEEDAVTYEITSNFVTAKTYHNLEEISQLSYRIIEHESFQEKLLEYLKP